MHVDDRLRDRRCECESLGGAVALRWLVARPSTSCLRLHPAAAGNGERRDASGQVHIRAADTARLEPVRAARRLFANAGAVPRTGLRLRHYGRRRFEWKLRRIVRQCAPARPEYHALTAVRHRDRPSPRAKAMRSERSYRSRPSAASRVFGDDVTDIDGFAAWKRLAASRLPSGATCPRCCISRRRARSTRCSVCLR